MTMGNKVSLCVWVGVGVYTVECDFSFFQVQKLDVDFLRSFSFVAQGCLSPLTSVVGGIVAQEGIIALTGKFSPLQQWVSQAPCGFGRALWHFKAQSLPLMDLLRCGGQLALGL